MRNGDATPAHSFSPQRQAWLARLDGIPQPWLGYTRHARPWPSDMGDHDPLRRWTNGGAAEVRQRTPGEATITPSNNHPVEQNSVVFYPDPSSSPPRLALYAPVSHGTPRGVGRHDFLPHPAIRYTTPLSCRLAISHGKLGENAYINHLAPSQNRQSESGADEALRSNHL